MLQAVNRAPGAARGTFTSLASGEPGWIAALDRGLASAASGQGLAIGIGLAVVFVAAGLGVFWRATTRPALLLSVIVAVAIWVLGENFGGLLTGQGTDPNTGLVLVLLAAAFWPLTRRPAAAVSAGHDREPVMAEEESGVITARNMRTPGWRRGSTRAAPRHRKLVDLGRPALLGRGPSMDGMTSVPDRARVRLPGISSRAYEHPADRSALVALRKLTGFDALLKRLASLFSDRNLRLLFLASSVRASNEQYPAPVPAAAGRRRDPGPARGA